MWPSLLVGIAVALGIGIFNGIAVAVFRINSFVATLAGCLCEADYASDPPAVLAALDARVRVESRSGSRELPVLDLITGGLSSAGLPSAAGFREHQGQVAPVLAAKS